MLLLLAVVGGIVFDEALGPGMVTEGVGDDVVALISAIPEGGLFVITLVPLSLREGWSLLSSDVPPRGSISLLVS